MNVYGKFTDIYSYGKRVMLLSLLMVLGATGAWGQSEGLYYIANDASYNSGNSSSNWYLIPADNPQKLHKSDAFFNEQFCSISGKGDYTGDNYGDPEMPFLTTYKTNKDAASVPTGVTVRQNNSVWILQAVSDEAGMFYIVHVATGKYLVYQPPYKDATNRKSVHLLTTDSPGENAKYAVTVSSGKYNIRPKSLTGWYFNPAGTQVNQYYANNGDYNHLGMVGVANSATGNSIWHFETALLTAPTITETDGIVTVSDNNSLPAGYNVRYTTDGSTPTASSSILPAGGYTVTDVCTFKAVIERYGIVLTAVASQAVEPSILKPTFTLNENGSVTITAETGNTIYYTLDGITDPTTSTTTCATTSVTISLADLQTATAIKAIAHNPSESQTSGIATQALASYTYKIVNQSRKVAIAHTLKQAVGKPLSGISSIPTAILSSYISDETVTFKTLPDDYAVGVTISQATLDAVDAITATPAEGTSIYITYTTTHLNEKFLHLRGARPLNLRYVTGSDPYKYLKDNSGTIEVRTPVSTDSLSNSNYLWYITSGCVSTGSSTGDPYDVWVQDNSKEKYVDFTSSPSAAFSLMTTTTAYFITANTPESGDDPSYEDVTLKNLASGETFTVRVSTVQVQTGYHLIDKAGNEIFTATSTSADLDIPDAWKSPLVTKYHFWKERDFDLATGKPKTDSVRTEIQSLGEVASGEQIYVTYDVDPAFVINTTESDLGNGGYMLHFSGGESFIQENGSDGLEASATKAEYPYSNGDACLYVYKADRWTSQMSSGASTRTRWLWHVVSPTGDPYHVLIMSHQSQASSHNFFRTYVVNYDGSDHLVTGVTTKHKAATDAGELPTEYRILRGALNSATGKYRCKLETVNKILFDSENACRTVNSFEQYWKNNPTVQNQLAAGHKVTAKETFSDNLNVAPAYRSELPSEWHTYKAFANAAPWVEWKTDSTGSGKKYIDKDHWFQTVNMGSDFDLESVELQPQVILLDNHGWEIMRMSMYTDSKMTVINTAALKAFDSPMVEQYHWYPTASKANGYHKYTCSNQEITVYNSSRKATEDRYTHNSTSLDDIPYTHIDAQYSGKYGAQDYRVKTDFYVTYTVKSEYANTYTGAATKGATQASAYLVKQGGHYAKITDGNALATTTTEEESSLNIESVPANLRWYVRPNFDIDAEMGYEYEGHYGEKNKADTEADNFAAGMNGFDPYNVQIQSAKPGTDRLFTTNANGSNLSNGKWTSTYPSSSTVSLQNEKRYQISADGLDQTTLKITNATFIVVDDGNGNMRLMPRFDNTKVVTSFTGLSSQQDPATAGDDGTRAQTIALTIVPTFVEKSSEIKSMGGYYMLEDNFEIDASVGTSTAPFKGIIDGQLKTVSGTTTTPFVAYADGAIIRNVIVQDVDISSGSSTIQTDKSALGGICNYASGNTRIYNCGILGGSVDASATYVGGIVGYLEKAENDVKDGARVINCFSYANVGGGTDVGGIVGYNNHPSTAADLRTMVMNCMFYGNITSGTNKSPVYGGENINNLNSGGLNTFNYYSYENLTGGITSGKYNCALAVEEKYLTRFEFYRLLLNSNKKLAAFYATGSPDNAEKKMAKWVLETADKSIDNPKPYPILKAQGYYPSIINYDVENAPTLTLTDGKPSEEDRNKGGKLGDKTLTVNISIGSGYPDGAEIKDGKSTLTLARTDKDFARFNFNYDKVQLPYYNDVGTKNYTGGKVVTGWKITSLSGGTKGEYKAEDKFGGYNFADRNCTDKDDFDVSGRVFSQGAYFDVPYGVTSIDIEPYWGNAAFVADANYDVVYNTGYGRQDVTQTGTQVGSDTKFNDKKVYTKFSDALGQLSGSTVYDNAIVLVGNFHQNGVPANGTKPFTIMSVDEDNDNEPDYSMIYHHSGRSSVSPIRFDFINIPGTCQAQKPNGATTILNFTIFLMRGWFETTNTCVVYSNQIEYENTEKITGSSKADSPLILLGGDFEQFVSTQNSSVSGKTIYIHVGSNVKIQSFGLGTHSDGSQSTPHVPVSVTGGEYEGFYLTGTYNPNAKERTDNAECYISGGHFVEAAGACQEPINGNVQWQIYNADIDNFFGGGINDAKPIKGTITTDIFNSHVGTFCGGPKFGNMTTGKAVTTRAEGCVFDEYFGAGYGGLSYSRQKYYDRSGNPNWTTLQGYYTTDRGNYFDGATTAASKDSGKDYGKKGPGVATDFDYEFFVWSSGTTGARLFVKFASFSLATCDSVSSSLKGCTVNGNYYGGGSLGEVKGKATSVLDGCTVNGNVFGGGFSATIPTVEVRDAGFANFTDGRSGYPNFNTSSGMFEPGNFSGTTTFEWKNAAASGKTLTNGQSGSDLTNHYLYTNVDLTALGKVGETDLTVKGGTTVTGSVFGGGDESAISSSTSATATGNTKVTIEKNDDDDEPTISNVYGGGNTADVDGDALVTMTQGTVNEDVYGGGKGKTTVVSGNVTVNIGTKTGESTYTGTGTISGNVYGGSALGAVNAKKDADYDKDTKPNAISAVAGKETKVNIYAGTVTGSVFGGGLGNDDTEDDTKDVVAKNFGPTTVTIENSDNTKAKVETAVYGGSNENGVLKGTAKVKITGGTIGTTYVSGDIKNVVFGGGFGQPTIVEGDVTVDIGSSGQASGGAIYHGNIYGGSALGGVNVSDTSGTPTASTKTDVNLNKGTIYGNVYGGGLGRKAADAVAAVGEEGDPGYVPATPAVSAVAATVGGNVNVTLDGAKLNCTYTGEGDNQAPVTGQIFGANNLNGTPKGHVKVHVKKTVESTKDTGIARDSRTTYDVAAVYGGGNQADYIPTDATIALNPADANYKTDSTKVANACAEVIIEGCDKTSIKHVYGGGNAAAVPATDVTILGSYIIDYVFGGGNGKGTGNPGANVGTYNNGATEYGSGKAVTKLVGGKVHVVYGGSNTKGNVRGGTSVAMPQPTETTTGTGEAVCSEIDVREIYGAGQNADQDGGVKMILGCIKGTDNIVYGGAKNANVKGGVDLVITSGNFKQIFGGNDTSGTIQGPIKLTIEETACDPIIIKELYLGGKEAAYSVYGYKDTNPDPEAETLVARTKAEYDALTAEEKLSEHLPYSDPVLNVVSCTSIGRVFGGGLGSTAIMYGSPTVNLNMVPGVHAASANALGVIGGSYSFTENEVTETRTGGIYGGGSEADVYGNPTINIGTATTVTMESVDDDSSTEGVDEKHPAVQGTQIACNVYGGGLSANVHGNSNVNIGTKSYTTEDYEGIGITGDVFGGGQGSTTMVTGNVAVKIGEKIAGEGDDPDTYVGNATITGSIYGGSALGSVNAYDNSGTLTHTTDAETTVTLNAGTIAHSVYGGGLGQQAVAGPPAVEGIEADVYGPVTVTVNNGTVTESVFGCNNLNGSPKDHVDVNILGGTVTENVYGGGNLAAYNGGDVLTVTMSGGTATDVFGGGLGTSAAVTGATSVNISGGTVAHDVYGGGSEAETIGGTSVTLNSDAAIGNDVYGGGSLAGVQGAVTVALNSGTVTRDVYGGGALAQTNTGYDSSEHPTYTTTVTLAGTTVEGNLYGGGLGRMGVVPVLYTEAEATAYNTEHGLSEGDKGYIHTGDVKTPGVNAVQADVNGPVKVVVTAGSATNVFGCNNLYGAPQSTVAVEIGTKTGESAPYTYTGTGTIGSNVYGGGNLAAYTGSPTVKLYKGTVGNNVYGGGLGTTAIVTGSTSITMEGGTVGNDVFGGGSQANVTGSVSIVVAGGTIVNNVYGGGALANTNTENWDEARLSTTYEKITATLTAGTSDVSGLYKKVDANYELQAPGSTAIAEAEYYRRFDTAWADGKTSASNTTTVTLTGGTIGNVFGGGLGNDETPVYVYGDVTVNVNKAADKTTYGGTGATFTRELAQNVVVAGNNYPSVPITGNIFGANNFNGSPKGNVTVEVFATKRVDGNAHVLGDYEIQGVYGGGNMASYLPATGKETKVIIHGCSDTSIEYVYGGGNSASVPSTDVTIYGAFDIGYAFAGGNGSKPVKNSAGTWVANGGAMVTGAAKISAKGGRIGQVFGGSDAKGDILGTSTTDTSGTGGECGLTLTRLFGAGNEADVAGDVNMILSGCGTADAIQFVHGGSYNAHIAGNVNLTITSGYYTNVFGGNDARGSIGGKITVNIEETDACKPIVIHNLVGGGNEAPYPGKKKDGTEYAAPGKVTVNIKSATRIDNVYGGGLKADVKGDTEVNINMRKGSMAGQLLARPASYTGDVIPNVETIDGNTIIKDTIGTIGNVFGGGNEGNVIGHTTVNIGTVDSVAILRRTVPGGAFITAAPANDSVYNYQGKLIYDEVAGEKVARKVSYEYKHDVLGAHITGSVYGGGNLANVGYLDDDTKENDENSTYRNTFVNICANENESTHVYEAVGFGVNDVTIAGNVFGGGNGAANSFKCEKAMVVGNTNVRIGNGTIGGDVYGGGKIGRVEKSTAVTIGLAPQGVGTSAPIITGYVFGAGQGVATHGYSGLTRGNSTVTIQQNAKVGRSVYGAGKLASLGRYWIATTPEDTTAYHVELGMPYGLKSGGKSTVLIQGNAEIGPNDMAMPQFDGNVFGAGKGILPYTDTGAEGAGRYYMNSGVYTWESYADENKEEAYLKYIRTLGITDSTDVTIAGNAFIKGSVYGGSENGHVRQSTHVKIQGGQIGNGSGTGKNARFAWDDEDPSKYSECASWTYGLDTNSDGKADVFAPYDKFANATGELEQYADGTSTRGGRRVAYDGHTYYGNVYGGGSGKDPYAPGKWHDVGGNVGGNTKVEISGGHILTSVYGGNELTDVNGDSCVVIMTGGTLGVPRTDDNIKRHPVTCYLFGAGKGDPRTYFNRWTNVENTRVAVSGTARIFGSVFGGGEDGHILKNAKVQIHNGTIGTSGTSYVDGNIFGGGRGYSGNALTAGSVAGNVDITITGGTMKGSVYGGGRLASVGIGFVEATDPSYGQLIDDEDGKTYGHVTINISGGTIGTTTETGDGHPVGGNVFGGSMGRLMQLDGTTLNPLWPKMAVVKTTAITISGTADIKNSVYGGSEYGIVRNQTTITMSSGTVNGHVYGGGFGSDNQTKTTITPAGYAGVYYTFTPISWAGCASGNTTVNISGGRVKKNVYGGGELASVGLIDFVSDKDGKFTGMTKHESLTNDFGLSWPYKFRYHAADPKDTSKDGKATVAITGTAVIDGYVFGGCKGKVAFGATDDIDEQRYTEAFCANVRETEVTIGTSGGSAATPTIGKSVYGGGEDGHVYDDAKVTIHHGTITNSVFGGGKGISKFKTTLFDINNAGNPKSSTDSVHSWTAGRVYGNTEVLMNGGSVGWFIYGGGNMASVGKGNYAGGADDYSIAGYGETLTGNLWTPSEDFNPEAAITDSNTPTTMADYFLSSGKSTVTIMSGSVGSTTAGFDANDLIPYGSVFGGSRGQAAADCKLSPRYKYVPDFYLGYVNKAIVKIGGTSTSALSSNTPNIYGSIYGGAQDGHVRNSTEVKIFKGNIAGQTGDTHARSGHVFGAGSGIGKYTDGEQDYRSNASGSVACTTQVDIYGGTIAGNVYGGGALASVGPPYTGVQKDKDGKAYNEYNNTATPYDEATPRVHGSKSYNKVTIEGGSIGGNVYGAGRGPGADFLTSAFTGGVSTASDATPDKYNPTKFATSIWTEVNIKPNATPANSPVISGSVYGGGEMGHVKESTVVNLTGGSIAHDVFGGGKGTRGANAIPAIVGGNATVELNSGVASGTKGCSVERIFGCNDLNGSPKGHVKVHVHATQNTSKDFINTKFALRPVQGETGHTNETFVQYLKRLIDATGAEGVPVSKINASVITAATSTYDTHKDKGSFSKADSTAINTAIDNVIEELGNLYDVKAVYGGGNLAQYQPYGPAANDTEADYKLAKENTEVIIDGCNLTSIKQVYGGGNAAPVPATDLKVLGTYEIEEVFGGGNGKDDYQLSDGKYYENPGANVGYYNYTHYHAAAGDSATTVYGSGTDIDPYRAIDNKNAYNKAQRQAYYLYGDGVASTDIMGGRIHYVYGGSNEKGNISKMAMSIYDTSVECPVVLDKTYGAGKNAEVDGDVRVSMECVNYTAEQFGGSTTSDVNSDITLIITNGHFGKVFGGNDKTGKINGSITVKVQESGCQPIVIDELYGGGYDAAYSIYGYNNDGSPRTKAQFETAYNTAIAGKTTEEEKTEALLAAGLIGLPYNNPQVLVVSASKIGTIYGGGEGYNAKMVGDTHVNVNMTNGKVPAKYANTSDNAGKYTEGQSYSVDDGHGLVTYAVTEHPTGGDATLAIGTIGTIYGGGNMADVVGDTYVEIGTGTQHNEDGELEIITPARNAAKITGDVYGGGKGEAPSDKNNAFAFTCASAMIGEVDQDYGSTHVIFENGTIGGNVYGGGKIARVEKNTSVTIGKEGDTTNEPIVSGYVFGAGQGVATHGYSGLTRGNSTVTLQGRAKIRKSVYGGGQMATVGKYVINSAGIPTTPNGGGKCTVVLKDSAEVGPNNMVMHNTTTGKPDDYGHVFGAGKGVTPYEGIGEGENPWRMTKDKQIQSYTTDETYLGYLETLALASETEVTIGGHAWVKGSVFGGSENGRVQTNTHVTIQENCQIGNGYAQMADDGTYLVSPLHINRRYSEAEWTQGHLITVESDPDALKTLADTYYKNSLPECASWKYGQAAAAADKYATYDPFAQSTGYYDDSGTKSTNGGRPVGDDGSTFYGNVFGGGSGYYPYAAGKWHWGAGQVGGSTLVEIMGGHIMTSVYGGNELTNVSDTCTVRMSGGTLGVPRTLGQITKHPVTCYLFGGGKGDPRVFFNKQTNVMETEVTVTDGIIYGSVFGGAEDGHVERNATVTIGEVGETGPKIGTFGTSYVDGNIFGGGRGYSGEAYTAGNVAGAVKMTINSGTMLGSIYGGGRLGSVGYGLYTPSEEGYGLIRDDDKKDNGTVDTSFFTKGRGHVDVTINGGTIGNEFENKYFTSSVTTEGKTEETIAAERATELANIKSTNNITQTDLIFEPDSKIYRLIHTRGGNVFAGGMGRMYKMDGSTPISDVNWEQLGNVKSTKLTINGGTIKSNVYGGCELGWVQGKHRLGETTDSVGTEILITGGTIGTEIKDAEDITRYTFGSVFGGGRGDNTEKLTDAKSRVTNPKFIAGRVVNSTHVEMQDGAVLANVYGGGEVGNVGMGTSYGEDGKNNPKVSTNVTISGGTIGKDMLIVGSDTIRYGGEKMGNVYGGGSGDRGIVRCGLVLGNSNVNISQAEGKTTRIYHNIYGGGAYGSVGDFDYEKQLTNVVQNGNTVSVEKVFGIESLHTPGTGRATVNITGGTIGVDGHENGMVFGSSRGEVFENYPRDDYMAWVYDAYVTIGDSTKGTKKGGDGAVIATPQIRGSIYGSGENGHTLRNTFVNIHSGTIGNASEYYAYRGNVYGAGCGTDYYIHNGQKYYKPFAGIVRGNTTVNIDGGLITGNVYGAGAMASVGTVNNDTTAVANKHTNDASSFALSWPYKFEFADTTGVATINITGGHIGINGTDGGDVYGSARGEAGDRYAMAHHAYAKEAVVNITYPATASLEELDDPEKGCIVGSVHGSGENGYVYGDTHVTLNKGTVGHAIYGGGKGYGKYPVTLAKIVGTGTFTDSIYSLIAGKVMGNTNVTMNDGFVGRNIYGGGNIASVGKGNYAGGADDYFPTGYGETLTGSLWDNVSDDSKAFWNSGITTVNVIGGTVGFVNESDPSKSMKEGLPYGNVFGSSRGEAAPNVPEGLAPRYQYCPGFFSGYVNETHVNIGGYKCKTAYGDYKVDDYMTLDAFKDVAVDDTAKWTRIGPRILGSVYGGGQDGHVRRDTRVTVIGGEIGLPYNAANQGLVQTTDLDSPQWLYRGNVFGAGSGIDKYQFDFDNSGTIGGSSVIDGKTYLEENYSTSAGSVTRFTDVNVLGGTIHRNVYGGGSLGSVGAPQITQDYLPNKKGDTSGGRGEGKQSQTTVTIGGAGPVTIGTPDEYRVHYGGEVYGASRGQADAGTDVGYTIWTRVNVKNGAVIQGNVYGGGDNGNVKRDTDVRVGE